jgi:hypothetical protein
VSKNYFHKVIWFYLEAGGGGGGVFCIHMLVGGYHLLMQMMFIGHPINNQMVITIDNSNPFESNKVGVNIDTSY